MVKRTRRGALIGGGALAALFCLRTENRCPGLGAGNRRPP